MSAVPPPSAAAPDVMAAANKPAAGGAKLGNSQSLRVRLDSYPVGMFCCNPSFTSRKGAKLSRVYPF